MNPPNLTLSVLLSVIGFSCLILGLLIWQKRRTARISYPLFILLMALSWWDLTYAVFWMDASGPRPLFWLDITYVGVLIVPAAFLVFSIYLAGFFHWVTKPFLVGLSVEPLLALIFMWTDPYHHLFFAGTRNLTDGILIEGGPIFWANYFYSNLLIVVGTIFLVRKFFSSFGLFKKQIGIILLGIAVPWFSSIGIFIGLNPLPNADSTPFSFSVAAFAFSYAIMQFRFLEVVPIARETIVDSMLDGFIVLDHENLLLDINEAGQKMLGMELNEVLGEPITKILNATPKLVDQFLDVKETRSEIQFGNPPELFFDLQISPIYHNNQDFIGRLIVFRDITKMKIAQQALHNLAITDHLTQTYNRRYFLEKADEELKRAVRYQHPLSLVLMDVDHFKQINDTHGHEVGDRVLTIFAQFFKNNIRTNDLFGRFGGDEFILLMPETGLEESTVILQRLQSLLAESPIKIQQHTITITFTAGITELKKATEGIDQIIRRADQGLYLAKEKGRNCFIKL